MEQKIYLKKTPSGKGLHLQINGKSVYAAISNFERDGYVYFSPATENKTVNKTVKQAKPKKA